MRTDNIYRGQETLSKQEKRDEIDRYRNKEQETGKTIAARFASDAWSELRSTASREYITDLVYREIAPDDTVASIGCGKGSRIRSLVENGYAKSHIGVDISIAEMVRGRKQTNGDDSVQFCAGDAENLPIQSGSVDVVIADTALHHLPNWEVTVQREVPRILRDDGTLLFWDPLRYNPLSYTARLLFESRTRTEAETPLPPLALRSALYDSFEEVDLRGLYLVSPAVAMADRWLPVSTYNIAYRLHKIENQLIDREAFPLAGFVIGAAKYPI